MTTARQRPESLLPLTHAVCHILLSLADADRHGYGIAKEVTVRTNGGVRFGPGTLYGTLSRMVEAGLVEEVDGCSRDGRRRTYRETRFGRDVARAEARRLAGLVGIARAKALLGPERS